MNDPTIAPKIHNEMGIERRHIEPIPIDLEIYDKNKEPSDILKYGEQRCLIKSHGKRNYSLNNCTLYLRLIYMFGREAQYTGQRD